MDVLTDRQRRWLDAALVLGTIALAFVVIQEASTFVSFFGDILLVFFLAWLLAFILSPIVDLFDRALPRLPRVVAVVIVYALLIAAIVLAVILIANALASSMTGLLETIRNGTLDDAHLQAMLAPWQQRLDDVGLSQINLVEQAAVFRANLSIYGNQLIGPLQQLAGASLGALGNLLLVIVLSLYMVADSDRILSFLFRIVPPARQGEATLLERSVADSFGGFLRGQAIMGVVYFGVALVANAAGGLDYAAVTAVASGILQAIPFFGPFVSWAPPVLVAIVVQPTSIPVVLVIMAIGWVFVMNVLQPRVMEQAVGIHPIVVLGSVLIGARVAGITGAIFGIPIAAVLSAFFFHYLGRSHEPGPIAVRAARRLSAREGRPVRIPREPTPAVDADAGEVDATGAASAEPRAQAHPLPADQRPSDA
ncbi:MAG TPA: AI-2E family transporter [Candidatus Limnocylindrales bacterium]